MRDLNFVLRTFLYFSPLIPPTWHSSSHFSTVRERLPTCRSDETPVMAAVSGGGGRGENLFCCICLVEIGKVGRGLPYFQCSLLCFSSALLIASPDCDLSRSHRCGKGSAETAATIPATFTDWPRRAYRVTPWRLAVASSSTFAMGDGHSGSWWDRQAVGGPLLAGAPRFRREGGHRALVSPSVRRQGW